MAAEYKHFREINLGFLLNENFTFRLIKLIELNWSFEERRAEVLEKEILGRDPTWWGSKRSRISFPSFLVGRPFEDGSCLRHKGISGRKQSCQQA